MRRLGELQLPWELADRDVWILGDLSWPDGAIDASGSTLTDHESLGGPDDNHTP